VGAALGSWHASEGGGRPAPRAGNSVALGRPEGEPPAAGPQTDVDEPELRGAIHLGAGRERQPVGWRAHKRRPAAIETCALPSSDQRCRWATLE